VRLSYVPERGCNPRGIVTTATSEVVCDLASLYNAVVSELEKKRDTAADQQREQNKRADAVDGKNKDKQDDDAEAEAEPAMPWDGSVDGIMERIAHCVRDLRVSMSHSEFRSLVVSYRELSPMGRRAVGNRLQQKKCDALFRALHKGDYSEYQHTWQSDAEAFRRAEEADTVKGGG
jgi:hypothetical protein